MLTHILTDDYDELDGDDNQLYNCADLLAADNKAITLVELSQPCQLF